MKNAFIRHKMAEEKKKISELEGKSIETFQTEKQENKKRTYKNWYNFKNLTRNSRKREQRKNISSNNG